LPGQTPGDAILVKVSTLPEADVYVTASDGDLVTCKKQDEPPATFARSDSTGALTKHVEMARRNNSFSQMGPFPAEDVVVSSRTGTSSLVA
jgi:hypothetical protein